MANICLYKIIVKGTRDACYALVNMMPLYSGEKECIEESGTDQEYSLFFTGDCKWNVDAYTSWDETKTGPYTPEEIANIQDGFGWNFPLKQKSLLLDCEIFCNSKDIDGGGWADYVHYNKGEEILDECPKELHIKRGREYGEVYVIGADGMQTSMDDPTCKVRFNDNRAYWYLGKYEVGDLVYVDGAKTGCLGIIKETSTYAVHAAIYSVTSHVGHVEGFIEEDILALWDSKKAKERKPYLVDLGLDEKVTKKKFVAMAENKWISVNQNGVEWEEFLKAVTDSTCKLDVV